MPGKPLDPERWQGLMSRSGLPPSEETFRALADAYREPHRHYHTGEHIEECLSELDRVRAAATYMEDVELSLWFHDAIYDTRSLKNEERSADWAAEFLRVEGSSPERVERVRRHILATRHHEALGEPDSTLVLDIDLSILGREPERYDRFEADVRKEYSWVPGLLYRRKRAEILSGFLDRARIYRTPKLAERYEETARRNLKRALDALFSR